MLLGLTGIELIMNNLYNSLDDFTGYFGQIITGIGALLVVVGGIYVTFIGWRKFKEASGKV